MHSEIIKNRIRAVRQRMLNKRINCLVVTKPANVTYITGFSGDESWALVAGGGVWFITDGRYTEQAHNQCPNCRIIERTGPMAEAVAKAAKRLKSSQVTATAVEKSASLADFEALKKNFRGRIKTFANIIEPLRSSKDKSEIAAIRQAAQIAAKALRQIRRYIKQGITENELAGRLDFEIRKSGAVNSFETIVAFGPDASLPHHQPSSGKLGKNDTILIDFGVKYENYCCDLTRCFAVGSPPALYKKAYNAVREAQSAAIKMVKAGVEICQVDSAARKVIAGYDLPVYSHGTGHGLGLEVHELPVVSKDAKGKLAAGEVITIEPAVYMPGKLGVRIEDDILVTDTGYEILTSS